MNDEHTYTRTFTRAEWAYILDALALYSYLNALHLKTNPHYFSEFYTAIQLKAPDQVEQRSHDTAPT